LQAAWNRADGKAYGSAFTADADFVDIRGEHHRGRDAIAGGHQAIFDTVYKASTIAYQASDARLVAPDVIVAHGVATLETPAGILAGRRVIHTMVFVRQKGAWQIAAFHNALVEN
jgi:uncharacterized protein (TIGR02246 family)